MTATGEQVAAPPLERLPLILVAAVVVVAIVVPFTALDANSLWLDELFTVYFTDPSQSPGGMFARALEDVHPPGYYSSVYALRRLVSGDVEIVGRAFSAFCAAATLVTLWFATADKLSVMARLLMLASAALSSAYFYASVELRSYAFTLFVQSLVLWASFRLIELYARGHRASASQQALVWAPLIAGCAIHSYFVLMVPVVAGYFFLIAPRLGQRLAWIVVGVLVVAAFNAFASWQRQFIVADVENTWFDLFSPFSTIPGGIRHSLGSLVTIATAVLAAAFIITRSLPNLFRAAVEQPLALLRTAPAFCILLWCGTLAAGIVYGLLFANVVSHRFFTFLVPLVWVLTGFAIEMVLSSSWRKLAIVILCFATLLASLRLGERWDQMNADWRASAAAIEAIPECRTAPIPIALSEAPAIRGDERQVFYGHYLNSDDDRLVATGLPPNDEKLAASVIAAVGGPQAAARRACPVLLWSVDSLAGERLRRIGSEIERQADLPVGCRVALRPFPIDDLSSPIGPLDRAGTNWADSAYQLVRSCG